MFPRKQTAFVNVDNITNSFILIPWNSFQFLQSVPMELKLENIIRNTQLLFLQNHPIHTKGEGE